MRVVQMVIVREGPADLLPVIILFVMAALSLQGFVLCGLWLLRNKKKW